MIVVRFSGGLGNQIYQYALYELLKRQYSIPVLADVTDYIAKNYHQGFELEKVFVDLNLDKIDKKDIFKITGRLPVFYGGPGKEKVRKIRKFINRKFFHKQNGNVIFGHEFITQQHNINLIRRMQDVHSNLYIDKFYPMVNDIQHISQIADSLHFVPFTETENILLANKIKSSTSSVGVHIRRGDYVGTEMDVLKDTYYKNAIHYVQSIIQNPIFYFFSDNPDYIYNEFEWLKKKIVVENNRKEKNFRDMQLMSLCHSNIIANSTFSVWAALLNKNTDKMVICPEYKTKCGNIIHYGLDTWIGISND